MIYWFVDKLIKEKQRPFGILSIISANDQGKPLIGLNLPSSLARM
jgi:hypothetical protein